MRFSLIIKDFQRIPTILEARRIHTSITQCVNRRWREERGLPAKRTQYGPLTTRPDFTFLDGRPTPIGLRERRRIDIQRQNAAKIVTGLEELQFAKERYQRIRSETMAEKQSILDNKFKPKGEALLQHSDQLPVQEK